MKRIFSWLLRRPRREAEWRDEIESHLAMRREWNQARGFSPEEARLLARRQFGSPAAALEDVRALHIWSWLESVWQDLTYAARSFRKAPSFVIVAIATVMIGVGASTAVFSAVDPILFRPLPYPKDYQLVSLGYFGPIDDVEFNVVASYLEWRQRQTVFQAITSMRPGAQCDLQVGDTPKQLSCYGIEANFLRTWNRAGSGPRLYGGRRSSRCTHRDFDLQRALEGAVRRRCRRPSPDRDIGRRAGPHHRCAAGRLRDAPTG